MKDPSKLIKNCTCAKAVGESEEEYVDKGEKQVIDQHIIFISSISENCNGEVEEES